MVELFKAPKLEVSAKRQAEIPFTGTVANLAWVTMISGRITYPFRVLRVSMVFLDSALNLVEHYWLIGHTVGVSATGLPEGENIFGKESPTAMFVGRGFIKNVNCNVEVSEPNMFIKLVTHNISGAAYVANATMIIQEL